MSNQSEIWQDFENQESFFDNISSNFNHQPQNSEIDRKLISRGFDAFYKNHRFNECLKMPFYIYQGFLTQMSEELPCRLNSLQNLSYARFQTSEYKVVLYKNEAFFELIFYDQETFDFFITEIRDICISSDFHQKYAIIKLVEEGKNSKTCLVQSTFDETKFTARVFKKMNFIGNQNIKQKEALINEVEALRVLKSCKFLQFCEVHETEWNIYIVTEYSGKDSLEVVLKRLASFYRISRKTAQKIMFNILETLAIFASHGIIHRNLKPSNILIEDEFNIKISNFNRATCRSSAAFCNSKICGTPGYMAPEMINLGKQEGSTYNEKCDIFAAGCIFFEMLFGFPLFNNFNLGSVSINQITMEEIQEFVFDIAFEQPNRANDDCLNLLLSLLQYDPNHRISAQEALNHPYFNNPKQRNENPQMKNLMAVSPMPNNFTEAYGQYQNSHSEENADVSDDEPDIYAKWSSFNHCISQKYPSKTRKQ